MNRWLLLLVPTRFVDLSSQPLFVVLIDVDDEVQMVMMGWLLRSTLLVRERDALGGRGGRINDHVRESSLEAVEKGFGVVLGRRCAVGYMSVVQVLDHGLAHAGCPLKDS